MKRILLICVAGLLAAGCSSAPNSSVTTVTLHEEYEPTEFRAGELCSVIHEKLKGRLVGETRDYASNAREYTFFLSQGNLMALCEESAEPKLMQDTLFYPMSGSPETRERQWHKLRLGILK